MCIRDSFKTLVERTYWTRDDSRSLAEQSYEETNDSEFSMGQSYWRTQSYEEASDDISTPVEHTLEIDNHYIESFTFSALDRDLETSAQLCIAQDTEPYWAISIGHHEGVLFVYNKPHDSSKFQLFGLLEEMPDIKPGLSEQQIESLYVVGKLTLPQLGVQLPGKTSYSILLNNQECECCETQSYKTERLFRA